MRTLIAKSIPLFIIVFLFTACRDEPDRVDTYPSSPYNEVIIRVNSPEYADNWETGQTHEILWTATPEPDVVDIHLYKKDEFIKVLGERVENLGKFTWQIGRLPYKSHHYMIMIFNSHTRELMVQSDHFYVLN